MVKLLQVMRLELPELLAIPWPLLKTSKRPSDEKKGPETKEHMESPYQPHWENSPETLVPDEAACETEFCQSESVVPKNHTAIECNWHSADMKPEEGSNVCFKLKTDDGDTEYEAKVLDPAGKSTGKNRGWLNVAFQAQDWTQGQQRSLNWTGDVKNWKYCDSGNVEEVNFVDEALYQKAKEDDITNWIENEVFSEVEVTGQSVITTRWVFSEKPDGSKKARLVARGFQEDQSDLILDSPTSSRESQRFALILMASYGFEIRSLDVKTAFLQGKKLERDVFLRPPADICAGKLWKLSKCVYGLADAARNWFDKVADFFVHTVLSNACLTRLFLFRRRNLKSEELFAFMSMIYFSVVTRVFSEAS